MFAAGRSDMPHTPPTLPYEDVGLCPFECCTYREWSVDADTVVLTNRKDGSLVAFRLRRGERVKGLTGVVVTTKFGKALVRQPTTIGESGVAVAPGETVHIINY